MARVAARRPTVPDSLGMDVGGGGRMSRVPLVVAAWMVVVGASTLPRVVLQELFHVEVSGDARSAVSASVIAVGLGVAVGSITPGGG